MDTDFRPFLSMLYNIDFADIIELLPKELKHVKDATGIKKSNNTAYRCVYLEDEVNEGICLYLEMYLSKAQVKLELHIAGNINGDIHEYGNDLTLVSFIEPLAKNIDLLAARMENKLNNIATYMQTNKSTRIPMLFLPNDIQTTVYGIEKIKDIIGE